MSKVLKTASPTYNKLDVDACKHDECLVQLPKMFANESIYILESSLSTLGVLQLGEVGGLGTALIFGILTSIGLIIKGIFAYYIHFWAQKDRPINSMLWLDNVSTKQILRLQITNVKYQIHINKYYFGHRSSNFGLFCLWHL